MAHPSVEHGPVLRRVHRLYSNSITSCYDLVWSAPFAVAHYPGRMHFCITRSACSLRIRTQHRGMQLMVRALCVYLWHAHHPQVTRHGAECAGRAAGAGQRVAQRDAAGDAGRLAPSAPAGHAAALQHSGPLTGAALDHAPALCLSCSFTGCRPWLCSLIVGF